MNTRIHTLKLCLAAVLILVLVTACGAQPTTGTQQQVSVSQPKQKAVKHSMGESLIPTEPQRIAVTHQMLIDWLVPLGLNAAISPKATPTDNFFPYFPEDKTKGIKLIGNPDIPNPEAFLAEQPDLIFIYSGHEKAYEQLSKVAPSVFIPQTDDWRIDLREYGRILGKEAAAEKWLQEYQQKADDAKAKLTQTLGKETVVFIRILPKELRIYNNIQANSVGAVLYKDLGLQPVSGLSTGNFFDAISMEKLVEMNPDHIIMQIGLQSDTDDAAKKKYEELTSGALWRGLTAIQKNHVYTVNSSFINSTPLGKSNVIDTLMKTMGTE
jgi:iron complex transport system substrate-binding protein